MTPVVIVGAGPTGLTAARLLAGRGVECLVLDRWESVYPQPRAVRLVGVTRTKGGRDQIVARHFARPRRGQELRKRKQHRARSQ